MSDKELLAQIAQVAGAINKHMNSPAAGYPAYNNVQRGGYGGARGRGRGRGVYVPPVKSFNRKLTLNINNSGDNNNSIGSLSTLPSSAPRPISTPIPVRVTSNPLVKPPILPSRHLSLINSNPPKSATGSPSSSTLPSASPSPSPSTTSSVSTVAGSPIGSNKQHWIQSKGKNMSMMSPASYKKTMEAKQKSIQSSKAKKLKLLQARAKLASDRRKGIVTVGGTEYKKSRDGRKLVMRDSAKDNVVINGVLFEMDPRGNKLVRKGTSTDDSSTLSALSTNRAAKAAPGTATGSVKGNAVSAALQGITPKQFSMGGVDYVRTTNGNLVRATLVKDQILKKRANHEMHKMKLKKMIPKKPRPFCKFYTRFGQCKRGPTCPFVHSRTHLAICKKFLRGTCPNTANTCKLSHTPSPNTTPACSHFQRAACNKDNCLYPHIRINPQAPICRPFATEGWCDAGINCKDRHVWICPDFGTPAGCKKKCGLAHVENGGIRVKRSAEEIEKERKERGDTVGSTVPNKRQRVESSQGSKPIGRYMDGLPNQAGEEPDWNDSVGTKRLQHDENFVPFDFDDDEEEAIMAQEQDDDENEVMGDFEGEQELDEDEEQDEQDDVSSDEVESDDGDDDASEGDYEENDDDDDSDGNEGEGEIEDEDYDEELERFYEEQDREDENY